MEDEEHAIFDCPEYNTCRLKYPEVFNLTLMLRNLHLIYFGILEISVLTPVVNVIFFLKLFSSYFTLMVL